MFFGKILVGFTNDVEEENDRFFRLTFEDQIKAKDSKNGVSMDIKEKVPEIEIKLEVLADEEGSSSSETKNRVGFTKIITFNPEVEAETINQVQNLTILTLSPEVQTPFPQRPSKNTALQERTLQASNSQQTSQVVNQEGNFAAR